MDGAGSGSRLAENFSVFDTVLIANRGEIACRIARACREMGVRAVAVYSEADRGARHTQLADAAVAIGPAEPAQSYLNIERLIAAAKEVGAQAVHPGYGFLAENADFAAACRDAGLVFIGPTPETLAAVGDKLEARRRAADAGVPVVPGSDGPVADAREAEDVIRAVGLPVILKAAGGGGGKGMRVVRDFETVRDAYTAAQGEAQSAFGDPRLYLEKLVHPVRHIEVQVLADTHGGLVHLGERDCSVQRRHQKLVEETPAPHLPETTRHGLWDAALAVMRAVHYTNAGTVEFLVEPDGGFSFLEVNARLQVEHPVTEMVMGVDLVHEQLRIAVGKRLGWRQEDLVARGAALECRVYAEDPFLEFVPSPGRVARVVEPSGPGVRVDSCLFDGCTVPLMYDPIVSKVITWGPDRDKALSRMGRALREYEIYGVRTTLPFARWLMASDEFRAGAVTTTFVADDWRPEPAERHPLASVAVAAAALSAARPYPRRAAPANAWRAAARAAALRPERWER